MKGLLILTLQNLKSTHPGHFHIYWILLPKLGAISLLNLSKVNVILSPT